MSQNSVIANLPEGCVFYEKVHTFITSKTGITKIKFITESAITSEDVLVEKAIYLVKNNETLENTLVEFKLDEQDKHVPPDK